MSAMKYSGMEWVGMIPEHWSIHPIYYYFCERKNKNSHGQESNLLSLSYGKIVRRDIQSSEGLLPENFNGYNIIEKNDIVMRLTDLQNDKRSLRTGLSTERGIITSAYVTIKAIRNINVEYFHFLLHTYDITKAVYNMGNGVRQSLNYSELSKMLILEPPLEEQLSITEFLISKCNEIETLITDIHSQIDTLEQYKQSVITEAVTRGVRKDTLLKNSDVAWCPSIPESWVVTNPKSLFVPRNQRAKKGERQLTASQKHGIIFQDDFMDMENQKVVTVEKDFSILKQVEPNDFVISMRSFQGGLEYSEVRGSISSAYVMLIPNAEKVYPPFFRWFFKSSKYINAIQSTTNLVRDGQAMRYANFVQVPLFIIPMDEQEEIAKYLDARIKEIDFILADKRVQLETLDAYKKSLIYEYVTGKKEAPII
jgi:type I restriction enzyme S subunit